MENLTRSVDEVAVFVKLCPVHATSVKKRAFHDPWRYSLILNDIQKLACVVVENCRTLTEGTLEGENVLCPTQMSVSLDAGKAIKNTNVPLQPVKGTEPRTQKIQRRVYILSKGVVSSADGLLSNAPTLPLKPASDRVQ